MTLTKLLTNLTVEKNGKIDVNPSYDSKTFLNTGKKLNELNRCDTTTKEGLEKYFTLTGDDVSKYSSEKVEYRKETRHSGGQSDLSAYANKHFNKILGEIGEETQAKLAFKYCPENDIEGNHKPYNTARVIVSNAKKTLQEIQENPDKYMSNELKKETSIMKRYIAMYTDEFFAIEQREAQKTGELALSHYDVGKFLKLTTQNLEKQSKRLTETVEEIGKRINTKTKIAEINKGRILYSIETANLVSHERKELEGTYEKYSDAQILKPFKENIFNLAIQEIESKLAKAAQ